MIYRAQQNQGVVVHDVL